MSLSQYIRDNTNDGHNIARVLIDVLEGRLDGTKISHRLTAARLLTIYGHEDADDFIAANTPDTPSDERGEKIWLEIDPGLRTLINARTDNGRVICMFLIDVMEGRFEGSHVGHRVSAARELLSRAYGKSPGRSLPKPPGSNSTRRQPRKTHQRVPSTPTQAVTSAPAASAVALDEPEQQSAHEIDPRIEVIRDAQDWLDIVESPGYEFMNECEHPDFDPYTATIDEEYFKSFTACQNPDCEVHGSFPEIHWNPNDYHY